MDYSEAIEYLDSFLNYEKEKEYSYPESFSLDRMRRLAKELGNPQNAYDSVIVAGSKGKGSTCAFLSSIFRMEGLKVGLYTSPHLVDLTERIRFNGMAISETRFAEYLTQFEKFLEEYSWRKDRPTYFEVLTAMAFQHFKLMKAQVAVLEVGLGGLYDATNIAEAKAVGIAPIGLEHTDKLGKTIPKISVQKCGVIKGREKVVSAPQTRDAEAVIAETVHDRDAELFLVGRELRIYEREIGESSQTFDLKTPFGNYFDLQIPLLGAYQIENAAVAVGLAKSLEKKTRLTISESSIRQGLAAVDWPGRLEKIWDHPKILVDGAHTPESLEKTVSALRRHFHFNRLFLVFGASSDKDVARMLAGVAAETHLAVVTESGHSRTASAGFLYDEALGVGISRVIAEPDPWQALVIARKEAEEGDLILVTGSLYLVGRLKKAISEKDPVL